MYRGFGRVFRLFLPTVVAVSFVAVLGSLLVSWMGIRSAPEYLFGTPEQVRNNASSLPIVFGRFSNGQFFGKALGFESALALGSATVAIFLLVAAPFRATRELKLALVPSVNATTRDSAASRGDLRVPYVAFWLTCILASAAAYVVGATPSIGGTVETPIVVGSARYLGGVFIALVMLAPLMVPKRSAALRAFAALLATVSVASAVVGVAGGIFKDPAMVDRLGQRGNAIVRFMRDNGVAYGYGEFWDAAPITRMSDFSVRIVPVEFCGEDKLCRNGVFNSASAYVPQQGRKTMLLRNQVGATAPEPPKTFGRPIASARFGESTVWVYDYDIGVKVEK